MKKHLPFSLEISTWTLMLWLILYQLDAFRWVLFCYGLMLVHEAFHSFAAFLNGCAVERIAVYPFGFCALIQGIEKLSLLRKLIVYLAGPLAHLIVQAVIFYLFWKGNISLVMKQYLTQINLNYLVFNLLPMYPLDGYRLMEAVFLCVFEVHSLILMQVISFLTLLLFAVLNPYRNIALAVSGGLLMGLNVIHVFQIKKEILEKKILRQIKMHHDEQIK